MSGGPIGLGLAAEISRRLERCTWRWNGATWENVSLCDGSARSTSSIRRDYKFCPYCGRSMEMM
jgi:NADH pyrophosphatase NudC (nudix superfamily)